MGAFIRHRGRPLSAACYFAQTIRPCLGLFIYMDCCHIYLLLVRAIVVWQFGSNDSRLSLVVCLVFLGLALHRAGSCLVYRRHEAQASATAHSQSDRALLDFMPDRRPQLAHRCFSFYWNMLPLHYS